MVQLPRGGPAERIAWQEKLHGFRSIRPSSSPPCHAEGHPIEPISLMNELLQPLYGSYLSSLTVAPQSRLALLQSSDPRLSFLSSPRHLLFLLLLTQSSQAYRCRCSPLVDGRRSSRRRR